MLSANAFDSAVANKVALLSPSKVSASTFKALTKDCVTLASIAEFALAVV